MEFSNVNPSNQAWMWKPNPFLLTFTSTIEILFWEARLHSMKSLKQNIGKKYYLPGEASIYDSEYK